MIGRLLTPLRLHFDLSPRPESAAHLAPTPGPLDDEFAPEDFARDVMIELMRNSVENLKVADNLASQAEILSEMQHIIMQNALTKDVFRELDGFLALMTVLSTIHTAYEGPIVLPKPQVLAGILDCTRLVFMVISEAIYKHAENAEYFNRRVGYEVLYQAVRGLVLDADIVNETLGYIISLALHDFAFSTFFSNLLTVSPNDVETKVAEFNHRKTVICQPGAFKLLWKLIPEAVSGYSNRRHALCVLLESLSRVNHRNLVIVSGLGLVSPLFDAFRGERDGAAIPERERYAIQKLVRRLLDMGVSTAEARTIFRRAMKDDETLDLEVLELVRAGMKARWPEHFSLEGRASLSYRDDQAKGLPPSGFTYMAWIRVEKLPVEYSHSIFSLRTSSRTHFALSVRSDGKLEIQSDGNKNMSVLAKPTISRLRWFHVTLVHHPHRVSNPSIRLFVDGVLQSTLNWPYPRLESQSGFVTYVLGDDSHDATMSWCMASAHFISTPLGDDLPRFIHHLGPRYHGNFQDPHLVKFLTYEASTSLNMFLSTVMSKGAGSSGAKSLMDALKGGLSVSESTILFSVAPSTLPEDVDRVSGPPDESTVSSLAIKDVSDCRSGFLIQDDVFVVEARCLDTALWKIGGAAVPLRLVQLANTPHELSRALGVLTDGLRNNWQNSEDMERLRGYDILSEILRTKSQHINLTAYETLFEFLGLNFRNPDNSTVTNTVAYRAIALNFELWSRASKETQVMHLEHFTTLLQTSRYKDFNVRQRYAKLSVSRKLIFVLQTEWYQPEMIPYLVQALRSVLQAHFSKDDAIKPVVSYLAANLHEGGNGLGSPRSIVSRIDYDHRREKAETVLECLVSVLETPECYTKFATVLPLTRICLLLLGERPSPAVAAQVLRLIDISLHYSSSFSRRFELVGGWTVLKNVLPSAWDFSVHQAAFDLLLGRRSFNKKKSPKENTAVECPKIIPSIFSALQVLLRVVADHAGMSDNHLPDDERSARSISETMIEELINLYTSTSSFGQLFKSQQTTQSYIDAYKSFVSTVSSRRGIDHRVVRILEKLSHFGLTLALDIVVAGPQKQEILNTLQNAEALIQPQSVEPTAIDRTLIVDNRSITRRLASARLNLHVGERTISKTLERLHVWRSTIMTTERKRLRKTVLDIRENRRQISRLQEWSYLLTSERGLWGQSGEPRLWRLDETEGPHRIRKKLEPDNEKSFSSSVEGNIHSRDVQSPDTDVQSTLHVEIPPWAESYEISATDVDDDQQLAEDIAEDKHRRVRHELEPGDVIEAVSTVARIAGVDSSPGLLIVGRTHLYMLDGLVENDDGEIIDAHDAPRRLLFVPGSIVELDGPQKAQRWMLGQILNFSAKTFLFRDVALELYFKDSRSLLIVFLDKKRRLDMSQRLTNLLATRSEMQTPGLLGTPLLGTPLLGKVSAIVMTGFRPAELSAAQRKWQTREISNFTYLSILNQISGRTPSDATQYPVFPWVLKDYTSENLDLTSAESYRDLTKPMGALTPARCEAARMRYVNLESVDEKPFHYGTHFSSSMIVCHFLIRLAPFTNMFKTLQGGDWDLPDRLFSDISRAYESASQDVRGDVRELIPEFFNCPEFLENASNLDFGVQQNTGERIHDVKLPPWAKNDPLLFIITNRRALESDYVSENLPGWIDLIWGSKQRDTDALNVFHPLSYEGSIDLDTMTDDLEREATVGIIHNFGQTPRKLFHSPHPHRFMHGISSLPLGSLHGIEEDVHLLTQEKKVIKDLGDDKPVINLVLDVIGEQIIPFPEAILCIPSRPHECVEWSPTRFGRNGAGEIRVVVDHKVVQVIEAAYTTCAVFPDADNLVTGSSDHTVRLWRICRWPGKEPAVGLTLSHIMRVHTARVLCVAASRAWSVVVSGSKDGSAAVWDLNRGVYIRSIWHGENAEHAVHLVAVNESTGFIATCSKAKLCLHTINGRPLASVDLKIDAMSSTITSIAFLEREYSRLGVLATGDSEGTITLRTWNADGAPVGERASWKFVTMRSVNVRTVTGQRSPAITALKFVGESLCHGEDSGRAYMWTLPD